MSENLAACREIVTRAEAEARSQLTPRQLECLRWVYAGKTDHEIAALLGVFPRTVHNHVEAAFGAGVLGGEDG